MVRPLTWPSASAYDSAMGVYKKRGSWYLRLPKQPDGRRPSYLLKGVTTEAQARAAERELAQRGDLAKLIRLDPSQRTIEDLRREITTSRAGHIKPGTLKRYDLSLRMLARDLGQDTLLRNLTAKVLGQWASDRLAHGGRTGKGMTRPGVNADLRGIRAALNLAEEWGYIERAPSFKRVLLELEERLPRHLTPDEVESVLRAEPDPRRRDLWTFFVWTGLRRVEALSLTWDHIHLTERPHMRVLGKRGKERLVPLMSEAVAALGEPQNVGPVWPQVDPDTYTHWFQDAALAAGVQARLHDLRHTAITWLLSRGVPPKYVQAIAGHANFSTTEGYARALIGDVYEAVATAVATGPKLKSNIKAIRRRPKNS